MSKIIFDQYGFFEFNSSKEQYIRYLFDWVALISNNSEKHFKWRVEFYEKPMYGQGKDVGDLITTLYAIDDIELDSWLASTQYNLPESAFLHNRINDKDLKVSSYVNHKKFNSPNGFMIKTGNTVDIEKTKTCEIMIGSTELFPDGKILTVSTYDILPTFFKFPHPTRMPGILHEETKGPLTKDAFKGCHDTECEVAYGDKSKFITINKYLIAHYAVKNINNNGKPIRNLNSVNEIVMGERIRWFNNCPKCGASINVNTIKKRASKY